MPAVRIEPQRGIRRPQNSSKASRQGCKNQIGDRDTGREYQGSAVWAGVHFKAPQLVCPRLVPLDPRQRLAVQRCDNLGPLCHQLCERKMASRFAHGCKPES